MRSRGAKVADIAILVVDAMEGVKEQTKEAIEEIKKVKIPLIVALHKIDKPLANPYLVQQQLAKEGILTEEMGGEIPAVKTSAKTGQGIKELLDLILLIAEMENLSAEISQRPEGVIVESWLDPKRGPCATLILEKGRLKVGDFVATNTTFGKIRLMENFKRERLKEILPGQAALILGFEEVPIVGEKFFVFESLERAKEAVKPRKEKEVEFQKPKEGQKILNLILKTDVLGTKEAIEEVLKRLPQEKVLIKILSSQTGEITEGDVKMARDFGAKILGFRVKKRKEVEEMAKREKVEILNFKVIYDLVEGVRKLMERLLEPEVVKVNLGKVKVLVLFWKKGSRQIIGGRVIEGEVKKNAFLEIFRNGELVGEGKILNLQKEKRDIEIAKKGEEIGILYEGTEKIKEDDILQVFVKEKREIKI